MQKKAFQPAPIKRSIAQDTFRWSLLFDGTNSRSKMASSFTSQPCNSRRRYHTEIFAKSREIPQVRWELCREDEKTESSSTTAPIPDEMPHDAHCRLSPKLLALWFHDSMISLFIWPLWVAKQPSRRAVCTRKSENIFFFSLFISHQAEHWNGVNHQNCLSTPQLMAGHGNRAFIASQRTSFHRWTC